MSGSYYGNYFMPCAAGVGYSYSPYKFIKDIDQTRGMLRLVMGLGTSAVDRTEGSYPRLVSLAAPEKTVYTNSADMHKFSQRKIEVVDTKERCLKQLEVSNLLPDISFYHKTMLLDYDYDVERRPATILSCLTAAICSRIWWSRIFCTRQSSITGRERFLILN